MGAAVPPQLPKGEPYRRHQMEILNSAGQPTCTRALLYVKPALMKPRMPRKAAGAMVHALSRTSLTIRRVRIRKYVRGTG